MTSDAYGKIPNGMSYGQVVAFVGPPSSHSVHDDTAGITGDVYEWEIPWPRVFATVQFQNGAVVSKAQTGLGNTP